MADQSETIGICTNCYKKLPENKIPLHEAYCFRNVKPCPKCKEMIDKKEFETHDRENHEIKKCPDCKKNFEAKLYDNHIENCDMKPKICTFCTLKIEREKYSEHVYQCSSRTQVCPICNKNVILRDYDIHEAQCLISMSEPQNFNYQQPPKISSKRQDAVPQKPVTNPQKIESTAYQKDPIRKDIKESIKEPIKEPIKKQSITNKNEPINNYQKDPILSYQKDPLPNSYQKDISNYQKDPNANYQKDPIANYQKDYYQKDPSYPSYNYPQQKDPSLGQKDQSKPINTNYPSTYNKPQPPTTFKPGSQYEKIKEQEKMNKDLDFQNYAQPQPLTKPVSPYDKHIQSQQDKMKEKEFQNYSQQVLNNCSYKPNIPTGNNSNNLNQGKNIPSKPITNSKDDPKDKRTTANNYNFYEKKNSFDDKDKKKPHMQDYAKEDISDLQKKALIKNEPYKKEFNSDYPKKIAQDPISRNDPYKGKNDIIDNKKKIPETKSAGVNPNKNYSNPTSNKPAPVYSNKVMNNNNGRPSNEINKYPASKPTYEKSDFPNEQLISDESYAINLQNELYENVHEYANPQGQYKTYYSPNDLDNRNPVRKDSKKLEKKNPARDFVYDDDEADPEIQKAIFEKFK